MLRNVFTKEKRTNTTDADEDKPSTATTETPRRRQQTDGNGIDFLKNGGSVCLRCSTLRKIVLQQTHTKKYREQLKEP